MGLGHVAVITTGGTIAALPQDDGDVKAVLPGQELLKKIRASDVEVQESVTLGSYAFTFDTLYVIGKAVQSALAKDAVDGVVITHGTDTMEETAFYLSLVTPKQKPVVLTGAQFDASHPSSDGPKNLSDAILVARSPAAASLGPVIVFAGFIYSGREVKKIDTNALQAFGAPGWGPVGRVDRGQVFLVREERDRPLLPLLPPHRVALIRLGLGTDGEEVLRIASGYEGVVLQAYGRGNAHPTVAQAVGRLVGDGVPVIVTSRCNAGAVAPIYGDGGGRDLERKGAWFAGDLAGEKARILLGLMLASGLSREEMYRIVQAYSQ
ncbi:asparaginase [Kyrpidia sp.]|uniref:asparaginase n=1 Tax=Kyrpidia sp. TaxID=2073077 RepID=UPI002583D7C7|nr:asparaginase [Kyrpidia sp.]MCL6577489.1 asparaginase [Kyrpidia sp.]